MKAEKDKKRAVTTEDIGWVAQEEVDNFLKIFSKLVNIEEPNESPEEGKDSEDGVADVVLFAVGRLSELLQCDINSLKLPKAF